MMRLKRTTLVKPLIFLNEVPKAKDKVLSLEIEDTELELEPPAEQDLSNTLEVVELPIDTTTDPATENKRRRISN